MTWEDVMPNPSHYKDQSAWMKDCLHTRKAEGKDASHEQSVAICLSMWRKKGKKKKKST